MSFNGYGGFNGGGGGYGGGGGGYGGGGGGGGYGGGGGGYGGGYGGGGGGGGGGYGGGGGGYGGRGRGRNDRGGRRNQLPPRTAPESTAVRMRKMVLKYADDEDFEAVEDPPRLAKVLRRGWREGQQGVFDGFRYAVTEAPYKQHHYVSLLLHLAYTDPEDDEKAAEDAAVGEKRPAEDEAPECGREVIEDLGRAFRTAVEGREWRNARLLLQFLSLLVPAGLVNAQSLLEVFKGLLAVVNEVGGGGDRAERAVRAVGEGLIRSAHALSPTHAEDVETVLETLETFVTGRKGDRALSNPLAPILESGEEPAAYSDTLSDLLSALQELREAGYPAPDVLPRPAEKAVLPDGATLPEPYVLSPASMPPEMYDPDEENPQDGEGRTGGLRLFGDDIIPVPNTVFGWTLRSIILDIVDVYEVNRKEAARCLLALPRYVSPNVFKGEGSESTYSLESLAINTLLATLCTLPASPQRPIYYGSVITELCKLSPNTVAPPVGRGVRKVFTMLGEDGLDVEVSRRITDWFAVHLSNFGYQWMWKEWIPDLELPAAHPRRAFMRRLAELEVRLAYHDRILSTLPEAMQAAGVVISEEAPDPVWQYEAPTNELHSEAVQLLKMMKQKATAGELKDYLNGLPGSREEGSDSLSPPIIQLATETLLKLGDRSFSHFLNATERYLEILRYLTTDYSSRRVVLDAVQSFWRRSGQMRLVTVDKYLQYGVLEPLDVVDWVFSDDSASGDDNGDGWTDGSKWEMLRMTLDKVVGRVVSVRRRLRDVDRADEAARARRAAERLEGGEGVGDDNMAEDEDKVERSREAQDAQASLDIQTSRLEKILAAVVRRFVAELLPWTSSGADGSGLKSVLALLASGEAGGWSLRARWGWWREFVRRYVAHLEPLAESVASSTLSFEESKDELEARAEDMVRRVWSDALGIE